MGKKSSRRSRSNPTRSRRGTSKLRLQPDVAAFYERVARLAGTTIDEAVGIVLAMIIVKRNADPR